MARLIAVETKLITNEMRTALEVRTNRSRPNLSVPSQCEPEPNGPTARCCQSSESYAYGLTSGPTTATPASSRMTAPAIMATRLRRMRAAALPHKLRDGRRSDNAITCADSSFMTHARVEPSIHEVSQQIKKEY